MVQVLIVLGSATLGFIAGWVSGVVFDDAMQSKPYTSQVHKTGTEHIEYGE